jgi:hypothetical protein
MNDKFIVPEAMPELPKVDLGVECSPEQTANRLSICKNCENFNFNEIHTICKSTGCNISLMTTFSFKQCPLEKW